MPRPDFPIPLARPRLPDVAAIGRYASAIDAARWYTNFGPLVLRFEADLARHFEVGPERVVTVANGTLGLVVSLLACDPPPGSFCLMPSWTFVASAQAVRLAGLVPHFVDVGTDGVLAPESVAAVLAALGGRVGAVMPVAPFGRPLDTAAWDAFAARTGIPVVIDAASGFDRFRPGRALAVISLNATKILGVGEGGAVLCPDGAVAEAVRRRTYYGFGAGRRVECLGVNAKLNEYQAAIGLAALEIWPRTRAAFQRVAEAYRRTLAGNTDLRMQDGFGETWLSASLVVDLPDGSAPEREARAAAAGIETRRWWGDGLHRQPAFAGLPRTALPTTETLARRWLALPCYPDLTGDQIGRIGRTIAAAG